MEPSRRSIPGLVERGQGRGFEYLHYPVAEPTYHLGRHPAVPNHYPINGARSADFPDIRRQWTVPRRCRLAFVNASEAGVPDQPMASCYLSRALVRIARRRACVRSSLLGQVDVREQLDVA